MSFYRKINLRSKKEVLDYLKSHYRYFTMNTWNNNTSFANKMKIHNFNLPDNAYDMLDVSRIYDDINFLIENFEDGYTHTWQAGFNGRSGGYLVLYSGKGKGHVNSSTIDWDYYGEAHKDLRYLAEVVQSFDSLCDDIVETYRYYCENYNVSELNGERILIPNNMGCPSECIEKNIDRIK